MGDVQLGVIPKCFGTVLGNLEKFLTFNKFSFFLVLYQNQILDSASNKSLNKSGFGIIPKLLVQNPKIKNIS